MYHKIVASDILIAIAYIVISSFAAYFQSKYNSHVGILHYRYGTYAAAAVNIDYWLFLDYINLKCLIF